METSTDRPSWPALLTGPAATTPRHSPAAFMLLLMMMTRLKSLPMHSRRFAAACRAVLLARRIQLVSIALCLACLAGCGGRDPFRYVRVSGDVRYRDGQRIECRNLRLSFTPLEPPRDARTHPRPGTATVDVSSGRFTSATTRKTGDGLVRGRHKVALRTTDGSPLPVDVAGPECAAAATTPLEIDTATLPLQIRVPRPTVVAVGGEFVREDGSPLVVSDAVCGFFLPTGDARSRDFREIGTAVVASDTGRFTAVSRGDDAGNGLFAGTYRVTLRAADGQPLPAAVVPETYADPRTTPLTLDTAASPVTFTVSKP